MDPVRNALYGRLASDGTLTSLLADGDQGVYHEQAPTSARTPYVIFALASGTAVPAMGTPSAFERDVWLVKAVDRASSATTAEAIAARIDALLHTGRTTLTITGQRAVDSRRASRVSYREGDGADSYIHRGGQYRLTREP